MMSLMVAVLLTDVCTVGSNREPLNVRVHGLLQCTPVCTCIGISS